MKTIKPNIHTFKQYKSFKHSQTTTSQHLNITPSQQQNYINLKHHNAMLPKGSLLLSNLEVTQRSKVT